MSVPWRPHRPCAKRPNRNGLNPRRRSTRRAHGIFHGSHSRDRKAGLADRGLDTRTAGLDRLEDWLNFFDFGEAALVDGGSVVDSSAAWLEVAPDEERYSSRTQPCCKLRAMVHPGYPRELNSKTGQLPGAVTKKAPNHFVEVRRKKALQRHCTGREAGAAGHVSARTGGTTE